MISCSCSYLCSSPVHEHDYEHVQGHGHEHGYDHVHGHVHGRGYGQGHGHEQEKDMDMDIKMDTDSRRLGSRYLTWVKSFIPYRTSNSALFSLPSEGSVSYSLQNRLSRILFTADRNVLVNPFGYKCMKKGIN
jgi:hypothetical protein